MTQSSKEELLIQIEGLLDSLIENATKMNQMASQVIVGEELVALQKKQDQLLKQLSESDAHFEKLSQKKIQENKMHDLKKETQRFDQKLQQFQKLNTEFIEKLNGSHGIIQFDKKSDD